MFFKHRQPQEKPLPEFKNERERQYYTLAQKISTLDLRAGVLATKLKKTQQEKGKQITTNVVAKARARFFKQIVRPRYPQTYKDYAAYHFSLHSTTTQAEQTKLDFPGECSVVGFYDQLIKRLKEEIEKLEGAENDHNSTIPD